MAIKDLEGQKGILRVLILMKDKGEINYYSIIKESDLYDRVLRLSLKKLKELGLIESRLDHSTYPPRNMISLTDKGRKVAEKLEEIEKLLEE